MTVLCFSSRVRGRGQISFLLSVSWLDKASHPVPVAVMDVNCGKMLRWPLCKWSVHQCK